MLETTNDEGKFWAFWPAVTEIRALLENRANELNAFGLVNRKA